MAATKSLLSRSQAVHFHSSGNRLAVLFLSLFFLFSVPCLFSFLPQQNHSNSNSDLNTSKDDQINTIPWRSMNDTEQARVRAYIKNQTEVALNMTKELFLNDKNKDNNMVYSPLSIHIVLSLIAAGSNGPTQDQLLTYLKSKSTEELNYIASTLRPLLFADGGGGGPRLSFTNGVWVEESLPVKPRFKCVVDSAYKAFLKQVNFMSKPDEVRVEVNSWAEKETHGRIKEILTTKTVNELTRLIIANALYFRGDWEDRFDASDTKEFDFYLIDGTTSVKTRFMRSFGKRYISVFDDFRVLKLPYAQGQDSNKSFSMYVFLPNERDGLPALVERFSSESRFLDRHLPHEKVNVGRFLMPKFKFSSKFDASGILISLGLKLPFVSGGLTEMVDSPDGDKLYVSQILHGSFIHVDDSGTEAAAVTVAEVMTAVSARIREKPIEFDFVADHPFLFLVREETTGSVMFVGQVLNPTAL